MMGLSLYASRTVLLYLACLVVLLCPYSTGVTHWKLQDNAIVSPARAELSGAGGQQDDYAIPNLQLKDPEFAVLLRHSSAGKNGHGLRSSRSSCPVVVNLDSQQVSTSAQCNEKQRLTAPRNPDGSGVM